MSSSNTKSLLWTIRNGTKEDIFRMVQEKEDIDMKRIDKHGKTVLSATFANEKFTEKDMIEVLEYFLDRGVDPNIENKIGKTALLEAALLFKKDAVDLLLRRQANVNKICKKGNGITHNLVRGWTLRYERLFSKNSEDELKIVEQESANFVRWLITKGFNFMCNNTSGYTALSQALSFGLQHISLVLLEHREQINDTDNNQQNLLHRFFSKNALLQKIYFRTKADKWNNYNSRYASKIVQILLDMGISAIAFDKTHTTPFYMAVARGEELDIIDMLLNRLVWSNSQWSNVVTIVLVELFKASKHWGDESRTDHFLKVARTLIAKGADVNAEDPFGKTAVYYAFQAENQCAADLLSENEADFSTLYENETNLYHVLADSEQLSDETRLEALFDLLADKACCDVNARDSRFRTPLHCAVEAVNLTIARKLIQYGADVNAKDTDGSTALHLAVGSRKEEEGKLVEFLLTSGAEVNLKNHSGERPLACVRNFTSSSSVSLLLNWGAFVNDYQDGESIFSRVFQNKGFTCSQEMLAYGLDINDSRICAFLESEFQYLSERSTEFFGKYLMKHYMAKLPVANYYNNFLVCCTSLHRQNCLRELKKLKSSFIDSQTSLYDYLHMDMESRVTHNNNEKLRKFVDRPEILEQEFVEYSVLILARYRTAVRWKSLLEPAKDAWLQLTHIALPDICIELIFVHLRIEDLVVMIEGV